MPATPNSAAGKEMPVLLEPSFPSFKPRPRIGHLNRQTAHLLFFNSSPFKLIFKIVPHATQVNYLIRPEIDYLLPRGSRMITVSMDEQPQSKKEHDFTYKIITLNANEGFGMSAAQLWERNKLDADEQRLLEAQFVCTEAERKPEEELESVFSKRASNGGKTLAIQYAKKLRQYDPFYERTRAIHRPPTNSPIYPRRIPRLKKAELESCPCLCQCSSIIAKQYFWQNGTAMRSFLYGFIVAVIVSRVLMRKS